MLFVSFSGIILNSDPQHVKHEHGKSNLMDYNVQVMQVIRAYANIDILRTLLGFITQLIGTFVFLPVGPQNKSRTSYDNFLFVNDMFTLIKGYNWNQMQ